MRRVAFLGTPDAAVPSLRALVAAGIEVACVVSQPDRRRGRGAATSPSPVKAAAVELGLPVTDRLEDLAEVEADLGVVVAYGRILPAALLDRLPMVNVHFSLLPRWRGAAPVERALLAGDEVTGVCVMEVVEALDAGGVHARRRVPIGARTTATELRVALAAQGAELLVETILAGLGAAEPQVGEVTYAAKLTAEDRRLDWAESAAQLDRVVRVGGAWTTFRGRRLRVWDARPLESVAEEQPPGTLVPDRDGPWVRAGTGGLRLVEVQPEGKGRQAAGAWVNGVHLSGPEPLGEGHDR